jgi:glycosyltransferase involved in cell wall biosynthesis
MMFLSQKHKHIFELENEFKNQIMCYNVSPDKVPLYLIAADYGLLIREESVTNKVASPVKFAEYLACGLKIIISPNLGDYSEYVINNDCGSLYGGMIQYGKPIIEEKIRIKRLSDGFKKHNYVNSYALVLNN